MDASPTTTVSTSGNTERQDGKRNSGQRKRFGHAEIDEPAFQLGSQCTSVCSVCYRQSCRCCADFRRCETLLPGLRRWARTWKGRLMDSADRERGAGPPGNNATRVEKFDVVIIGAGISGIGSAGICAANVRQDLCDPRWHGELRRHLAHPPLSRDPVGYRSLYLRIQFQALDRGAAGDPGPHPRLSGCGDRGKTISHGISATVTALSRPAGRTNASGGCWRSRRSPTESGCASRPASCGCARAITGIPRAICRLGRAWMRSWVGSSIRRTGPRTWTMPKRTSS